jgi:hypothetical protein
VEGPVAWLWFPVDRAIGAGMTPGELPPVNMPSGLRPPPASRCDVSGSSRTRSPTAATRPITGRPADAELVGILQPPDRDERAAAKSPLHTESVGKSVVTLAASGTTCTCRSRW